MSAESKLFENTAGKLSQLRALIKVMETADLSSFDDRTRGSYIWLALDLANECEDLLFKFESQATNKIQALEQQIKEQNQGIDEVADMPEKTKDEEITLLKQKIHALESVENNQGKIIKGLERDLKEGAK